MHLGAHLLEPLLVCDTEMLLLVDDEKAEITEFDRLAQERVGAHDDVDGTVGYALLRARELLAGNEAGGLGDLHRESAKTLRDVPVC